MKVPVLLILFNRPLMAKSMLERLGSMPIETLYVALDGPRSGVLGDQFACSQVKQLVSEANFDFPIRTTMHKSNVGCKANVSGAISWFFAQEDEGIVLEDDCLPDESFFAFGAKMLTAHREDHRVAVVSGSHYRVGTEQCSEDYFFSRYPLWNGWATWKRSWKMYDGRLLDWPAVRSSEWLLRKVGGHRDAEVYWRRAFDRCYAGKVDSWAWPWMYSLWRNDALSIHPTRNLVLNVGFGPNATHTKKIPQPYKEVRLQTIDVSRLHLKEPTVDVEQDRWFELNYLRTRREHSLIFRAYRLAYSLGIRTRLRALLNRLQRRNAFPEGS